MILVDTSVLIDFSIRVKNPGGEKFKSILEQDIPLGITSLIYQEILQGAKSKNECDGFEEVFKFATLFSP